LGLACRHDKKIDNNQFKQYDGFFVTRTGIKTKDDEANRLKFLKNILK